MASGVEYERAERVMKRVDIEGLKEEPVEMC